MNEKTFIDRLCADLRTPKAVDIIAIRQFSIGEHVQRAQRLVGAVGALTAEAAEPGCRRSFDRADWRQESDRSVARLPQGGRIEVFHASGALQLRTGLPTMAALFGKPAARETLQPLLERVAQRLRLGDWVGPHASLAFERLWQIKAAAADKGGKPVEPVLCRLIGAYRQTIGALPVLGGASVAVRLAAGGAIDAVSMQLLEAGGDTLETATLIGPDQAARQVHAQLDSLMGRSKMALGEMTVRTQPLQLGYLHLGRRKTQRLLAPHYVASVEIDGEDKQAYQIVVPATQRGFVPLCLAGQQPPPPALRRAA